MTPHPRNIATLATTVPGRFLRIAATTASTGARGSIGLLITDDEQDHKFGRWADLREIRAALTLYGYGVSAVGIEMYIDNDWCFEGFSPSDELPFDIIHNIGKTEFPQSQPLSFTAVPSDGAGHHTKITIAGQSCVIRTDDLFVGLIGHGVIQASGMNS